MGVKSGGKVSFGGDTQVVSGKFYKLVSGVWRFYVTTGVTSCTNLQLADQTYPGVSIWTGFSTYGASGCPLYTRGGEFLGLNVGVVTQKNESEWHAIFIRASAIMGYYLAKAKYRGVFAGKHFGLTELVRLSFTVG